MGGIMKSGLIVDPCPSMRVACQTLLAHYDFDVRAVDNGAEAIRQCRINPPDFILLSSVMPDMGGLEFLCNLRQSERGRRAAVLFCSANRSAAAMGLAIYKGAGECLIKPFDADLLDFKLRQIGALPPFDALNMAA